MIEPLALATALGCVVAALVTGVRSLLGRHRWRSVAPTLLVLQLALVAQAAADGIAQLGGHRPGEPAVHLGYLLASLAVLPVAAAQAGRDDDRWAGGLLVVALLAVAVVVVRMQTTWRPG